MPLVVQKFGGSSVATADGSWRRRARAIRAKRRQSGRRRRQRPRRHHRRTDRTGQGRSATALPRRKWTCSCPPASRSRRTHGHGHPGAGQPAISFTGAQIGIVTDSFHTKARIKNISTQRMRQALDEGKIVIVAGFQGVDENYNITTLGRGGSDTTAVALAAVMQSAPDAAAAKSTPTWTASTPPTRASSPRPGKIDRISYDEMLELASVGAGVMHSRSIEFAKKFGVPIHPSQFIDNTGTWIVGGLDAEGMATLPRRLPWSRDEVRITVSDVARIGLARSTAVSADCRGQHRRRHDRSERTRSRGGVGEI